MDIVVLVDGSGRRPPAAFRGGDLGLGPGVHIFVRSRGSWLVRQSFVRPGEIHVRFVEIGDRVLLKRLNDLWAQANTQRPGGQDDDFPYLEIALTLDACRGAALLPSAKEPQTFDAEHSIENEVADDRHSLLETLDATLNYAKADLEFIKYLLGQGPQIHHALHLIAFGDPTGGLFSVLIIVFKAMGQTFVADHDLQSLAEDVAEKFGSERVRVTIEAWDSEVTLFDICNLIQQDKERWIELEGEDLRLSAARSVQMPTPAYTLEVDDDLGLSL